MTRFLLTILCLCFSTHTLAAPVVKEANRLRIATWNVEHLAYPADKGCKPRSEEELSALRAYAQQLNADIVALQEVASAKAVQQVFPSDQWQVIMSDRPDSPAYECRESGRPSTQQKVAFAVRKALEIRDVATLSGLGLQEPGLRYGLTITVDSSMGPLTLLNVHMKSGCFVDDYQRADSPACKMLAQQIPLLDAWIESMEAQQRPYMVLGDFNHRLSAPYNRFTRDITTLKNGEKASLRNLTSALIGCHPRYPAPIDHIFAGQLPSSIDTEQVKAHHYPDMSDKGMLSDHCAVSATLRHAEPVLSGAVKWQTQSKEYRVITEYLYQQASATITSQADDLSDWVVVMDLDETVLDNSAYQVMLEATGQRYQKATWDNWVRAEQATLVPGAAAFIAQVINAGGRLALITNRDKALNEHTWRNLEALSLPVSTHNTCLLGRGAEDKPLSPTQGLVNDKDRRRQAIRQGSAACYVPPSKTLDAVWRKPHNIVMQVGDNIEDIAGTTQENALPAMLVPRVGKDIVVLPNPMYGSW